MKKMISYILLALASICNAIMDTLAHHYSSSKFQNLNDKFWNPNISWQYAHYLPFTNYKIDAWHLFKSAMIVFMCASICFANSFNILDFICLGILWNIIFNLFYNHLLIKK